jgi:integrase
MARNKLTVTQVKGFAKPGKLGDGDGLYLHVSKSGGKSWAFVYIRDGRRREMGLGPYGAGTGQVSLADARSKADEVRSILGRGGDPFFEMTERRAAKKRATFAECADLLLKSLEGTWRNPKHEAQWKMTLGDAYCKRLRKRPVAEITTDDIVTVLEPHWRTKHETASRLRGRIERVLDYAKVEGLRDGENPARWKGHIEFRLPKPKEVKEVDHHAAMPYRDVPEFMAGLKGIAGVGARALEFLILTAARTGEVIEARWPEIDFDKKVWTVPADRMKANRIHRVPLTDSAMAVINVMKQQSMGDFIFPGQKPKKPISNMTMAKCLKTLEASQYTVHGFRSSFRDWVSEETSFAGAIAEAALAHTDGDKVELAYRRGDVLAKRRRLMEAWAGYLSPAKGSKVVPIRAAAQ